MNLDESLREKQVTNGPFEDMAQLSQAIKFALRRGRNWEPMGPESKEALELITTHFAKILVGDANEAKHWNDIAVLARIRGKALEGSLEKNIAQTAQARVINPKNLFDAPPRGDT
jgi:hypothetical protein